jgi:hypothetical protein
MSTTQKFRIDKPRTTILTLKTLALDAALFFAAAVCGFWMVGSRNLLYWTHEMSEWINGDNGPDVLHIIHETVKLILRITIGGYGCYGLFKNLTGAGKRPESQRAIKIAL